MRVTGAPELAEAVSIVGQLTVAELPGPRIVTPEAAALASTAATATDDAPALSIAVAVTMYRPGAEYLCAALEPFATVPSPKSIVEDDILPPELSEALIVKSDGCDTLSATAGALSPARNAIGADITLRIEDLPVAFT